MLKEKEISLSTLVSLEFMTGKMVSRICSMKPEDEDKEFASVILQEKTDFWKNIYKQLAEQPNCKYMDENGQDVEIDHIVYANKDYAIIAVYRPELKKVSFEMYGISADSDSIYLITWVDKIIVDNLASMTVLVVTEQDVLLDSSYSGINFKKDIAINSTVNIIQNLKGEN